MTPRRAAHAFGRLLRGGDEDAIAQLRTLFEKHDGNLRAVARSLGVSEQCVRNWTAHVKVKRRTRADAWKNAQRKGNP